MSADESPDGDVSPDSFGEGSGRVSDQFDERVVDVLSWILDTETRARIYVQLRQHPNSTSDELAEETGLYPSTVREELAALHGEGRVHRRKRQSDRAGNNPYEYSAIPPSDLVSGVVEDVQTQLNAVFNMDQYIAGEAGGNDDPVTIRVTEEDGDSDDETAA